MPDLARLLSVGDLAADLGTALPEVAVLADLAEHWRELAEALIRRGTAAPFKTPEQFIAFLSGAIGDDAVGEVFGVLGLSPLHDRLKAVIGHLADGEGRWGKLLSPVSRFGETYTGAATDENGGYDAGNGTAAFALALPRQEVAEGALAGAGSLRLSAAAGAALEIEPGALWPFPKDDVAPGLVRVGASGLLQADGGASVPFGQIGAGAASASTGVAAEIGLFYRPASPEEAVAGVVLRAAGVLPDPFDLASVRRAMDSAGLEGLVMRFKGQARAALSVTFGRDVAIPQWLTGKIGVTADLGFARSGDWLLSLRRSEAGALRFVLSRDRLCERNWALGVGIEVDPSALVGRVRAALIDASGRCGPTLDQIKPFLTPGAVLQGVLQDRLTQLAGQLIADPDLRAALAADAGLLTDPPVGNAVSSALAALLESRIAGAFDSAETAMTGRDEDIAGAAVDKLIQTLPVFARDDLRAELAPRIGELARLARQAFDAKLMALVPSKDAAEALGKELKAAGVTLDEGANKIDRALAGVRDLVGRFDGLLKTLVGETADAARTKLTARAGWDGAQSDAAHYEVLGTLDADTPEARVIWTALVTGRLQPVQALFVADAARPAGLTLDPQSSLARTVSSRKGFAAELIVAGLQLSVRDIALGTATIARTAGGDVTVHGESLASHEVSNARENRRASFVSVWDLVRRRADPLRQAGMGLSLQLEHRDSDLRVEEVKGLFAGCAALGLIDPSRMAAALAVYQSWSVAAAASGGRPQGEIALRMVLPDRAVERMLATGRLLRADPAELERHLFGQAVAAMLATGYQTRDLLAADVRDAHQDFDGIAGITDPVDLIFRLRGNLKLLAHVNDDGGPVLAFHGPHYTAFRSVIARANSLVGDPASKRPGFLEAMANIADATPADVDPPAPGTWSAKTYDDAGLYLASVTQPWLRANMALGKIRERLDPLLLAFMLLLARFASPEAAPHEGFLPEAAPDPAWANPMFRIVMTPTPGTPVAI